MSPDQQGEFYFKIIIIKKLSKLKQKPEEDQALAELLMKRYEQKTKFCAFVISWLKKNLCLMQQLTT